MRLRVNAADVLPPLIKPSLDLEERPLSPDLNELTPEVMGVLERLHISKEDRKKMEVAAKIDVIHQRVKLVCYVHSL